MLQKGACDMGQVFKETQKESKLLQAALQETLKVTGRNLDQFADAYPHVSRKYDMRKVDV